MSQDNDSKQYCAVSEGKYRFTLFSTTNLAHAYSLSPFSTLSVSAGILNSSFDLAIEFRKVHHIFDADRTGHQKKKNAARTVIKSVAEKRNKMNSRCERLIIGVKVLRIVWIVIRVIRNGHKEEHKHLSQLC